MVFLEDIWGEGDQILQGLSFAWHAKMLNLATYIPIFNFYFIQVVVTCMFIIDYLVAYLEM